MSPASGYLVQVIVGAVETSISPAEAYNVAIVLPWLSEFLGRIEKNFITADLLDLTAFCQERAETRSERSMDRLIGNLRVAFQNARQRGTSHRQSRLAPSVAGDHRDPPELFDRAVGNRRFDFVAEQSSSAGA